MDKLRLIPIFVFILLIIFLVALLLAALISVASYVRTLRSCYSLAGDWQITWPIFFSIPSLVLFLYLKKKIKIEPPVWVLLFWIFIYEAVFSLGVVSSRFLLPSLPVLFIIGVWFLRAYLRSKVFLDSWPGLAYLKYRKGGRNESGAY